MKKEELQGQLAELERKELDYQFLKDAFFSTQADYVKFKEEHKEKINELNAIKKEQKKIKWELMSEKERKDYLEYLEKIKEKYQDE